MAVIKYQQKLVYELYEYLEQKKNDKRQKIACLLGGIHFPIKIILSTMSLLKKQYIEMTQCYLIFMNPALPTSIMIFRIVLAPPILVKLNQVARMCLCYGT